MVRRTLKNEAKTAFEGSSKSVTTLTLSSEEMHTPEGVRTSVHSAALIKPVNGIDGDSNRLLAMVKNGNTVPMQKLGIYAEFDGPIIAFGSVINPSRRAKYHSVFNSFVYFAMGDVALMNQSFVAYLQNGTVHFLNNVDSRNTNAGQLDVSTSGDSLTLEARMKLKDDSPHPFFTKITLEGKDSFRSGIELATPNNSHTYATFGVVDVVTGHIVPAPRSLLRDAEGVLREALRYV